METLWIAAIPFRPLLALSVILLLFHIGLQGLLSTLELGSKWNAGPRDGGGEPKGRFAGRAARASRNFQESYPAFVALLFGTVLTGSASGWWWALAGGWVWFAARVVYIPLYLFGIAYLRSLIWTVSMLGLLVMTIALFR